MLGASDNKLGAEGGKAIGAGMASCPSLHSLDLEGTWQFVCVRVLMRGALLVGGVHSLPCLAHSATAPA